MRELIRAMALKRGRDKTFCPSEVARAVALDWRGAMPEVRRVAAGMQDIRATQRGIEVDAVTAKGPIRLGLRP